MQHVLLVKTTLLFLLTVCLTLALQESFDVPERNHKTFLNNYEATLRTRRALKKPGFLRTLFSVIYEQWNDTRNTFGTVNKLINDNFLPENGPVVEATTPSDSNISTTQAPYRITRTEFNKILQRNLRGLQRLFDLELQDALRQSKKNHAEFRRNATLEISKFL